MCGKLHSHLKHQVVRAVYLPALERQTLKVRLKFKTWYVTMFKKQRESIFS